MKITNISVKLGALLVAGILFLAGCSNGMLDDTSQEAAPSNQLRIVIAGADARTTIPTAVTLGAGTNIAAPAITAKADATYTFSSSSDLLPADTTVDGTSGVVTLPSGTNVTQAGTLILGTAAKLSVDSGTFAVSGGTVTLPLGTTITGSSKTIDIKDNANLGFASSGVLMLRNSAVLKAGNLLAFNVGTGANDIVLTGTAASSSTQIANGTLTIGDGASLDIKGGSVKVGNTNAVTLSGAKLEYGAGITLNGTSGAVALGATDILTFAKGGSVVLASSGEVKFNISKIVLATTGATLTAGGSDGDVVAITSTTIIGTGTVPTLALTGIAATLTLTASVEATNVLIDVSAAALTTGTGLVLPDGRAILVLSDITAGAGSITFGTGGAYTLAGGADSGTVAVLTGTPEDADSQTPVEDDLISTNAFLGSNVG
jgi:hypothetical protein